MTDIEDIITHNVTTYKPFNMKIDDFRILRNILNDMFAEVSDLRKSIVSNLGDAISKAIMESGLDAMQLPSNLKDNDDVVFSIEKLQDEYKNGTMRLDVIANAMDSLITEMLNSRDVAQSILNMVAEINSRR